MTLSTCKQLSYHFQIPRMPSPGLRLQTPYACDPQGIGGSDINHYGNSHNSDFLKTKADSTTLLPGCPQKL